MAGLAWGCVVLANACMVPLAGRLPSTSTLSSLQRPAAPAGREFFQCDFDVAGAYAPMVADAEVLKVRRGAARRRVRLEMGLCGSGRGCCMQSQA